MPSDETTLYMLRGDDDGWASPAPATTVIRDTILESTALTADELDDVTAYVDRDVLAAVVEGTEDEIRFDVEGVLVTVASDGSITVD